MNSKSLDVVFTLYFISLVSKSTGLNVSLSDQKDVDSYLTNTMAGRYEYSQTWPDPTFTYSSYIEHQQSNYQANQDNIVFFVWDYKKHSEAITRLLFGEKVTLHSDVKQSDNRYDSFRLTEVHFNIKTSDKSIESTINNVLFNFELESDHLGKSYFRSNGQYCLIPTGKYKIWYSLENDEDGSPVSRCFSYDAIKMYMFSPFASWELQLLPALDNSPKFPILQQYKEKLQIELMGRGSKLDNKYLKEYCKPINSANLP